MTDINVTNSTPDSLLLSPYPAIAVIGAGYWGKNLVRNFYQLGVLKTICDGDKASQKMMEECYPEIHVTGDVDEVLNDPDIRGVIIATPAALHYQFADKALRSGKDVFVEKPLSLTYREGKKLVSLTEERKQILFVGHILQYHAAVIALKQLIKDGRIGRLQYIYSRRLSFGKIRREENILWSFAPHDISVILGITGEEPSYIDSVGNNFLHARIPDVTMTTLKFPSGIGAHVFVSWLNPYKEQRLVIVGSNGMLVFDDTEPVEKKLVLYPHTINWHDGIPVPNKAESIFVDLSQTWKEPLRAECEAFLTAMETRTPSITSGEEGLRVLKILELSQQSIEQKDSYNGSRLTSDSSRLIPQVSVHKTAVVDEGCEIGEGTRIWHFTHVISGSQIGENCNIGQNVVIGPDVTIGTNCKVQNNVSIYKGVTLEEGVFCGPSMVFTNVYNPRAEIRKMDEARPTLVKKGATIGANATVVCGNTLGSYCFIGAGAVVINDVPDHALMVGNPAVQKGWVCKCGEKLNEKFTCTVCKKVYQYNENGLKESSN